MPELPSGTVTLVFTDVEGSTQLVHKLGQRYEEVLADHGRLLREAVADADGQVVDHRGDEFFVVFSDARRAAQAVVAAQQALAAHSWPDKVQLRVRMGIHTGEPIARAEGYFGLDVHRAARICQAGSGGQVLVSQRTREEIDAVHEFVDLGDHELPGLPDAERLHQLNVPGLPTDFPELSTARKGFRGVRVVLADDSVLLREGIARLLEDAGFDVVAQGGTAEDLLRHVGMHKPDVALVDIRMPPTQTDEGLRAAKEIRERWPDTGVLVRSQVVRPASAR